MGDALLEDCCGSIVKEGNKAAAELTNYSMNLDQTRPFECQVGVRPLMDGKPGSRAADEAR